MWHKKDRYAHYLTYATLVTLIPLFGTKLCQLRLGGIFGEFMKKNEGVQIYTKKKGKIHQKYLSTVTDITLSPKEVLRSPGGHMKDNVYTYLFSAIFFW